jgi:hypothetical protein
LTPGNKAAHPIIIKLSHRKEFAFHIGGKWRGGLRQAAGWLYAAEEARR